MGQESVLLGQWKENRVKTIPVFGVVGEHMEKVVLLILSVHFFLNTTFQKVLQTIMQFVYNAAIWGFPHTHTKRQGVGGLWVCTKNKKVKK